MTVILYTTLGCHLCEQALAMLTELNPNLCIEEVEISADDLLLQEYGLRIPVIAITGKDHELGWPFNITQLADFLAAS